jgi:signal transduction histidine kinase/ActR/RegA family two-component response regulator
VGKRTTSTEPSRDGTPRALGRKIFAPAVITVIVLVGTVLGALAVWSDSCRATDRMTQQRFDRDGVELLRYLSDRTARLELALRAGVGLMQSSDEVTRREWSAFVETMMPQTALSGMYGMAYIERVEPGDLDAFIAKARGGGAPGFDRFVPDWVESGAGPGVHYILLYHAPEAHNRVAWGLDVAANPENRAVYDQATDSGEMRFSLAMRAIQNPDEPGGSIIACMPVYRGGVDPGDLESRRAAIRGWVAVSFKPRVLMEAALTYARFDGRMVVERQSTCGRSDRFETDAVPLTRAPIVPTLIRMHARESEWAVHVLPGRSYTPDYARANRTGAAALAIAILVTVVTWLLSSTRWRAVHIAEAMTADLRRNEEQLRALADEADQANRAKSLFIANISHDVRTPMTAIVGYADLLREELGPDAPLRVGEAISAIERGSTHLLGLINDVLDLSKIEAGRMTLEDEAFDLGELIAGCLGIVRQHAAEKGLTLAAGLHTPIPAMIRGDAMRLRQALLNLLSNAVKFTSRGGITLTAWSDRTGDDEQLWIQVEDTGIGIQPDHLERIFSPFEQVDPSHSRLYGGTGLGLTITRRIVRGMGGEVEVESVPGRGSRFRVRLPVRPGGEGRLTDGSALLGSDQPRACAEPLSRGLSGRVLLAEDGPDNQRLIRHILTRAGLSVDIVGDGESALHAITRARDAGRPYRVLLLDMQLPRMDGYEVAGKLRSSGFPGRVIALTAHAMLGDREKCLNAGCDEYLSKPFRPADLIALLERCLAERRAA